MSRVMIFTGSRGEWGYIKPVISRLSAEGHEALLVVSNMHTDPVYGLTENEIINEGFEIYDRIPMNVSYESENSWAISLGFLASQVGTLLDRAKPDLILLAGDRAETFVFSVITYYTDIPIAHIQAGELSGHKDGMARHAIGKLAHIHFTSNADASARLKRLGEEESRIFETGAPQLDDLCSEEFRNSGSAIIDKLRLRADERFVLSVFHGNSGEDQSVEEYIEPTNKLLKDMDLQQIWILPNNDAGSSKIDDAILGLPKENVKIARNLPRNEYAFLLAHCKFMIGNSSSGILEAPALGTWAINIGNRQKGRQRSETVIDLLEFDVEKLRLEIEKVLKLDKKAPQFLYGEGGSSNKIVNIISNIDFDDPNLLNKYLVE